MSSSCDSAFCAESSTSNSIIANSPYRANKTESAARVVNTLLMHDTHPAVISDNTYTRVKLLPVKTDAFPNN